MVYPDISKTEDSKSPSEPPSGRSKLAYYAISKLTVVRTIALICLAHALAFQIPAASIVVPDPAALSPCSVTSKELTSVYVIPTTTIFVLFQLTPPKYKTWMLRKPGGLGSWTLLIQGLAYALLGVSCVLKIGKEPEQYGWRGKGVINWYCYMGWSSLSYAFAGCGQVVLFGIFVFEWRKGTVMMLDRETDRVAIEEKERLF